jgi:uncharacterized protein YodC (DUF2158 family)
MGELKAMPGRAAVEAFRCGERVGLRSGGAEMTVRGVKAGQRGAPAAVSVDWHAEGGEAMNEVYLAPQLVSLDDDSVVGE